MLDKNGIKYNFDVNILGQKVDLNFNIKSIPTGLSAEATAEIGRYIGHVGVNGELALKGNLTLSGSDLNFYKTNIYDSLNGKIF